MEQDKQDKQNRQGIGEFEDPTRVYTVVSYNKQNNVYGLFIMQEGEPLYEFRIGAWIDAGYNTDIYKRVTALLHFGFDLLLYARVSRGEPLCLNEEELRKLTTLIKQHHESSGIIMLQEEGKEVT